MRYQSKDALLTDIRESHDGLCERLRAIPRARWREAGVWGDGWTVGDLVAHLVEWHRMFLSWYDEGLAGRVPPMPAAGYRWNETPRLNRAIWRKHRSRTPAAVWSDFTASHRQIVALVESLTPSELLRPGSFHWTGKYPLTTYLGANTASHYRFASKVLDRWRRQQRAAGRQAER